MAASSGRIKATFKFLFWTAAAVGMFSLVAYLHTSGKFSRWYYYSANEAGYAINADTFKDATKEAPVILQIGDFKAVEGCQAALVKKGDMVPENTNGIITMGVLIDDKRVRFKETNIKVNAPIEALNSEAERLIEEEKKTAEQAAPEQQKGAPKDGYAIDTEAARSATPENPIIFEIVKSESISGAQAVLVKKGAPMPVKANAVITENMLIDGSQTALEGNGIKVSTPMEVLKEEGGYAVNTASISGASESNPALLKVTRKRNVGAMEAFPIKKGDIIPIGVNGTIKKIVLLDGKMASVEHGEEIQVLLPWEIKDSKGFKFKDTFKHKGIKTLPLAAVWNVLIVIGLGVSLGYMAEGFTDFLGMKLEKIQHFGGH